MKYTISDIKNFKKDVCPNCRCYQDCLQEDNHWFMSCPKIFNYKLGFKDGLYHYKYELETIKE